MSDINWFAIHSKRYGEALAASSLAALGIKAFLPMVKVECHPGTVIKVNSKPLFAGYLFARFSPAVCLDTVESARGVAYVIKCGPWPIPVDDQVVREIQNRVAADGLIRLQDRQLRPGDWVCVMEGPFAGMMGRVEGELDDRKRVAILLEALWSARVLIEKRWVEAEAA